MKSEHENRSMQNKQIKSLRFPKPFSAKICVFFPQKFMHLHSIKKLSCIISFHSLFFAKIFSHFWVISKFLVSWVTNQDSWDSAVCENLRTTRISPFHNCLIIPEFKTQICCAQNSLDWSVVAPWPKTITTRKMARSTTRVGRLTGRKREHGGPAPL